MVSAGGIIVIFLDHLNAMQWRERDFANSEGVFGFEVIFKERSFYVFSSQN